jgi:hypothetical protein
VCEGKYRAAEHPAAVGGNDTEAIDWIELLIQVVLAAVGVAAVAGIHGRRRG